MTMFFLQEIIPGTLGSLRIIDIVIILGSSSVIAAFMTHILNIRRKTAEADNVIIRSYGAMVDDLQEELRRWKDEVKELKLRMDAYAIKELDLQKQIDVLEQENRDLKEEIRKLKKQ